MAGGNWGQPQPWVWGTSLGMGTGQTGTSAYKWRWFGGTHGQGKGCEVLRSCSLGRAKATASAGSSSSHQGLFPQAWEPPHKVTMEKGPPLAAVALSWPPVPAAKASWPPADCLITLTAELSIRLSEQLPHKGCIVTLLWLENKRWQPYAPISLAEHNFPGTVGSVAISMLVNEPCLQHFAASIALEKTWVDVFLITCLGSIFVSLQ